jgi:DNA primase
VTAGFVSRESIQQVQQYCDIVEVISQHVQLKKAGTSYKGLCPFHEEKTPSFNVHPGKQIFKCFGCQKGGDVIKFVEEFERVPFHEALQILADRSGITLKYEEGRTPQRDDKRERYYDINRWAVSFFENNLQRPMGEVARQYLADRGISDEMVKTFRIGYSPDSWDGMLSAARSRKIPAAELEKLGLVIPRKQGDGHYDRFRNRLMFPIYDTRNRPIGFGGRVLPGAEEGQPKYINSPESVLFSKGSNFYALNLAKEQAMKDDSLVVVEGYTDVIAAHQAGVGNVIATLGTAMTEEHLRMLRRFTRRVVILFDMDNAGQDAAARSIDLMLRESMEIRVATLGEGKDPVPRTNSIFPWSCSSSDSGAVKKRAVAPLRGPRNRKPPGDVRRRICWRSACMTRNRFAWSWRVVDRGCSRCRCFARWPTRWPGSSRRTDG